MEYLSALKKSVVAGLMIGIGCTVFLNMDNSIVASFLFRFGFIGIDYFDVQSIYSSLLFVKHYFITFFIPQI